MNVLELFQPISTFIFDVDGVMTDASVFTLDDGQQVRRMNTKDGYVLQLAIRLGYRIAIISGGNSEGVRSRLSKLGVEDIFIKVEDKLPVLQAYLSNYQIDPREVLYMGDDIPDYKVMQAVGLSCCPADAVTDILQMASYISPFKGGEGCVRDVIEKVLRLHEKWTLDTHLQSK